MKRVITAAGLLVVAFFIATNPKVAVLTATAGIGCGLVVFCTAGLMDGLLAMLGAPSAFADKILKGLGLIKK